MPLPQQNHQQEEKFNTFIPNHNPNKKLWLGVLIGFLIGGIFFFGFNLILKGFEPEIETGEIVNKVEKDVETKKESSSNGKVPSGPVEFVNLGGYIQKLISKDYIIEDLDGDGIKDAIIDNPAPGMKKEVYKWDDENKRYTFFNDYDLIFCESNPIDDCNFNRDISVMSDEYYGATKVAYLVPSNRLTTEQQKIIIYNQVDKTWQLIAVPDWRWGHGRLDDYFRWTSDEGFFIYTDWKESQANVKVVDLGTLERKTIRTFKDVAQIDHKIIDELAINAGNFYAESEMANGETKLYHSKKYGFEIKYPKSWESASPAYKGDYKTGNFFYILGLGYHEGDWPMLISINENSLNNVIQEAEQVFENKIIMKNKILKGGKFFIKVLWSNGASELYYEKDNNLTIVFSGFIRDDEDCFSQMLVDQVLATFKFIN